MAEPLRADLGWGVGAVDMLASQLARIVVRRGSKRSNRITSEPTEWITNGCARLWRMRVHKAGCVALGLQLYTDLYWGGSTQVEETNSEGEGGILSCTQYSIRCTETCKNIASVACTDFRFSYTDFYCTEMYNFNTVCGYRTVEV